MGMKRLIVLGTAPNWKEDLDEFDEEFGKPYDVMVINDAGLEYLGDIHHWISLHPNLWFRYTPTFYVDGPEYAIKRERAGGNTNYRKHSHMRLPKPHTPDWETWEQGWKTGSSALFGVYVALQLGYDKIVTIGVELSEGTQYEQYRRGWHDKLVFMKDRVKGFKGWPESVLGKPKLEWWNDVSQDENSWSVGDPISDP